ncbi:MAG: CCA tRNA nucleotidyltransferase [Lachnospiraceae bacterium]|nr:CCA tRNA nucleotidyltransferase [Lachnospiraceae bacterium]
MKKEIQIILPEQVSFIINTLNQAGFEAYAVGGCVRDSIMGRVPDDWDITTSADPQQVKKLFRRTIDTGIQHGTVTVMLQKTGYEVTTYRIDGEYEDNRHPKEVIFTKSLEEDLKRRDFTVNAMAYHPGEGLVDLFDGIGDMEKKCIRCVGQAEERFSEDALRMMRGVRFSAQFGYRIEEQTREAIRKLRENLRNVSAERIRVELVKLLVSPHPDYLRIACDLGITKVILPEFDVCMETPQHNPHHCYSVGEHTLEGLKAVRADKVLRLAMLLHDIGKPLTKTTDENGKDHFKKHPKESARLAQDILRRLKFDNDTLKKVCRLVEFHDWSIDLEENVKISTVRRLIANIGEDAFPDMFEINRADLLSQSSYLRERKLAKQEMLESMYREIMEKQECLSLKDLAVGGKDLLAQGIKPGKELGEILQRMLADVFEDPAHNKKEYLLENLNLYL